MTRTYKLNVIDGTARDKLRDMIERVCVIDGMHVEERESTINIVGVAKFMFTPEGELKSIIRGGKSYTPDGERVLR